MIDHNNFPAGNFGGRQQMMTTEQKIRRRCDVDRTAFDPEFSNLVGPKFNAGAAGSRRIHMPP